MLHGYVTEPGVSIRYSHGRLILEKQGRVIGRWKLAQLERLVLFGGVHLTTPALTKVVALGKTIAFVTKSGRLLGQVIPPRPGNVELRFAQYCLLHHRAKRCCLVRNLVREKIAAMENVLSRYADNYPELPLDEPRDRLRKALGRLEESHDLPTLRGIEGAAASTYWKAFGLLNRSSFGFCGRKAHPARDAINALLSLGYTFLTAELSALLEIMGFDAYLGYYHEVRSHRPSLALDIMEPFRHAVIDRMVLRAVNLGRFHPSHFRQEPDGRFYLGREGWRIFLGEYERAMQSTAHKNSGGEDGSWRAVIRHHCERLREQLASDPDLHDWSDEAASRSDCIQV